MEIVLHHDAGGFAAAVGPLLQADPIRHTMALSVLDAMHRGGGPSAVLLTVHEKGEVTAAALRWPCNAALVSAVPPRLAPVVERALAEADPAADAVSGPVAEAEAFAAARVARTGCRAEPAMRMRLFALDVLVPPRGVRGRARRAGAGDVPLLGAWRRAFEAEVRHDDEPAGAADAEELVARSLRLGAGEMLWEVDGTDVSPAAVRLLRDGVQPPDMHGVAQACAKPVLAGVSRIGPVYTAPEHRGYGYAAAVTAAASQWALDEGAQQVLLFTDLTNGTANRLYPRIGYRPAHDAVELRFSS